MPLLMVACNVSLFSDSRVPGRRLRLNVAAQEEVALADSLGPSSSVRLLFSSG
jgi:hypothetical protein